MNAPEPPVLGKAQYEALSEFRFQLRRFLRFSEDAARAEGLTPLQYQLLLHVRGFPGRDWATVGELSLRLQTQQHGVVALLTRCEDLKLLKRRRSESDKRQVEVHLTRKGEQHLARLAALHRVAHITAFNDADKEF